MVSRGPDPDPGGTAASSRWRAHSASTVSGRRSATTGSAFKALAAATSPVSFRKTRRSIITPENPATALREAPYLAEPDEKIDTVPVLFYYAYVQRTAIGLA